MLGAVSVYNGALQVYPISYTAVVESGIEAIETEGEAEYFNLQGVRVANPGHGLFIRIQNGKAEKVLVK